MTDTTNVTPAPAQLAPDSPEYMQKMAATYDAAHGITPPPEPPTPPPAPVKPTGIPDKFWDSKKGEVDYASMAKSYVELEKKLATPTAAPTAVTPTTPETPTVDADGVKPAADTAPFKLDETTLADEILTAGDLKPETYAALEKAGIPKSLAEHFVSMQKQLEAVHKKSVADYVGGEAELKALTDWGKANLSTKDVEFFEAQLNGDNWQQAMDLLQLRKSKTTPDLVRGGTPSSGTTGFRSEAEMVTAMRDPRYQTDTAYRDDVMNRLKGSQF
jgi:hypothetical protein